MEGIIESAEAADERRELTVALLDRTGWEEVRFLLEEIVGDTKDEPR